VLLHSFLFYSLWLWCI